MYGAENSPYMRSSDAAYTGPLIFQARCAMFSSVGRNMCIPDHLYGTARIAGRTSCVLPRCKRCNSTACLASNQGESKNGRQQPSDGRTNPPSLKAGKWGCSEGARTICEGEWEKTGPSLSHVLGTVCSQDKEWMHRLEDEGETHTIYIYTHTHYRSKVWTNLLMYFLFQLSTLQIDSEEIKYICNHAAKK